MILNISEPSILRTRCNSPLCNYKQSVIKSLEQDGIIESKNIVIFTASSDRTVLDEIKNSGVKEIFKKPCSLDDLTALIEKYRPGMPVTGPNKKG